MDPNERAVHCVDPSLTLVLIVALFCLLFFHSPSGVIVHGRHKGGLEGGREGEERRKSPVGTSDGKMEGCIVCLCVALEQQLVYA